MSPNPKVVKVPHGSRHIASTKKGDFDPRKFLATGGEGKQVLSFAKVQTIFTQGDVADAVFYIFDGKVRLTVVSSTGKEATLGIVNVGNFVGEGCLTRQPVRMCSATAIPPCKLLCIDKKAMMFALHREHALSDMFVAYLLTRNIRYGEDLVDPVDQLFNSSKKLWLAFFSCWLASVRKAYRRLESNKSVRKLWQRWWVQLAGE